MPRVSKVEFSANPTKGMRGYNLDKSQAMNVPVSSRTVTVENRLHLMFLILVPLVLGMIALWD